jgi:hypothetical protein
MAVAEPDSKISILDAGGYRFTVKDSIQRAPNGMIYSRNFQIGGTYPDCVNVSIKYNNEGKAIEAKIPTLMYDPECASGIPLSRKGGSVIMIKTLLRHIHSVIPEITIFNVDDKSTIECGTEEEIRQKRHRKRGTHAVPVTLYYFSIAFNGVTWYEKYFNAKYSDPVVYKKYRDHVTYFREKEPLKPFEEFLLEAQPPMDVIRELEPLYRGSTTYEQFFTAIPSESRCRHARKWLIGFIEEKMKGVFTNKDWIINTETMDSVVQSGGLQRRRNRNDRRKTRRRRVPQAYPRGAVIRLDGGAIGWDVGA